MMTIPIEWDSITVLLTFLPQERPWDYRDTQQTKVDILLHYTIMDFHVEITWLPLTLGQSDVLRLWGCFLVNITLFMFSCLHHLGWSRCTTDMNHGGKSTIGQKKTHIAHLAAAHRLRLADNQAQKTRITKSTGYKWVTIAAIILLEVLGQQQLLSLIKITIII